MLMATAADNKLCAIFPNLKKGMINMRIVCQQTIKFSLNIMFENAAKFEIVVCYKLEMALYGLKSVYYKYILRLKTE